MTDISESGMKGTYILGEKKWNKYIPWKESSGYNCIKTDKYQSVLKQFYYIIQIIKFSSTFFPDNFWDATYKMAITLHEDKNEAVINVSECI